MNETPVRKYEIIEGLLNDVVNYLSQRPYREVEPLLSALKNNNYVKIIPFRENDVKETKEEK